MQACGPGEVVDNTGRSTRTNMFTTQTWQNLIRYPSLAVRLPHLLSSLCRFFHHIFWRAHRYGFAIFGREQAQPLSPGRYQGVCVRVRVRVRVRVSDGAPGDIAASKRISAMVSIQTPAGFVRRSSTTDADIPR